MCAPLRISDLLPEAIARPANATVNALVATDVLNASTTSTAVTVTVNTGVVQVYYIHADQLDTPRQITDTNGIVVWQWDNVDPFGNNMANENPAGQGAFNFNLRFPGQYFDRETNTHYNFHRDYDPAIGRYIESDPIGLGGGVNTYSYVKGNPLIYVDPLGLTEYGPITESLNDFLKNYKNMRDANTIGADKYFHCMANCQAARRGPVGVGLSELISETREQTDEKLKGDSRAACDADRAANNQGRNGKNSPDKPCSGICQSLRPNGLDPKY